MVQVTVDLSNLGTQRRGNSLGEMAEDAFHRLGEGGDQNAHLPPSEILNQSVELLDECLGYAARLIRAGVAAELIVYPGCFHGFRMALDASVTKRADADSLNALRKALAR